MNTIIPILSNLGIAPDGNLPAYQDALHLLLQYKYLILIPITVFEGPIIMLLCGFLLRLGFFEFWPVYLTLMAADLLGDTLWYSVGYYAGRPFIKRFGKFFSVTEKHIELVSRLFHRYHNSILIISKITMGLGFALVTLITAGISKVPFQKYITLNAIGQIFWTGLLMAAGFFLGHFYETAGVMFGRLTSVALLVILCIGLFGLGKYVRARLIEHYVSS